jgi:cell division protein FtsB
MDEDDRRPLARRLGIEVHPLTVTRPGKEAGRGGRIAMPVSRSRRKRRSPLVRWLAVAVIGVIAFAYVHPVRSYLHARDQVQARRTELGTLERERQELARRLALSETDQFVVEEARRIGLVRPGERLFIVKGLQGHERGRLR